MRMLVTASAGFAAALQLNEHALTNPSGLMALAAVALAAAITVLLARSAWLGGVLRSARLPAHTSALRRKAWGAVFQRQLNPDAAGRARPRAPSADPAAA